MKLNLKRAFSYVGYLSPRLDPKKSKLSHSIELLPEKGFTTVVLEVVSQNGHVLIKDRKPGFVSETRAGIYYKELE